MFRLLTDFMLESGNLLSETVDIRVRIDYSYVCSVEDCNTLHDNWAQWSGCLYRRGRTTDALLKYCEDDMVKSLILGDYNVKTIVHHKLTDYTILE
jgi:hypothetical protein